LIPVRVEDVASADVPEMLRPLIFGDLFARSEEEAQQVLLRAVAGPRRPDHQPVFPGPGTQAALSRMGESGPELPESVSQKRHAPVSNPRFTGPRSRDADSAPAAPPVAPSRIFVSYRRDDTAYPSGWLFDRLTQHFGKDQVFKDIDSIQLGDDFVEVITAAVASCDVLLAIIGREWLTIADEAGRRRLDNANDFVRLELETALTRNIRIIPVLVEGARVPRADELPPSLAKLARRQALELSPSRFDFDVGRLLKVLDSVWNSSYTSDAARVGSAPPSGGGGSLTITIDDDGHFVGGDEAAVDLVLGLLEIPEAERSVQVRATAADDIAYRRKFPDEFLWLRGALKAYESSLNLLMRGGARYYESWQIADLAEAVIELRGLALPGVEAREWWFAWSPAAPSQVLNVRFTENDAQFIRSGYYRHIQTDWGLEGIEGLPEDEPIWLASIFPSKVWQRVIPAAVLHSVKVGPDDPQPVDVTGWVLSDRPPNQLARKTPGPDRI